MQTDMSAFFYWAGAKFVFSRTRLRCRLGLEDDYSLDKEDQICSGLKVMVADGLSS